MLTGVMFAVLYWRYPPPTHTVLLIALCAFVATLIPIFFIDLATFTVPDSLNILLFVIPVVLNIDLSIRYGHGYRLLWGWMPESIVSGLVGALIFGSVRIAGWLWKGVEAMGLGDVLLGRGMGAMLSLITPASDNPLRLLFVWVLFSCLSGIVIGPLLIWIRTRQNSTPAGASEPVLTPETYEREGKLSTQIGDVVWCLLMGDIVIYLRYHLTKQSQTVVPPTDAVEWVPLPSAIPFGPFLVVGFLAAIFCGEHLTAMYLSYALKG